MAVPVPSPGYPEPPSRGRVASARGAAATRLVGRDEELVRIVEALRHDRWVVVLGEAGIGKTSLVRSALAASDRGAFEGGGFATLAWMPYLALSRAVGRSIAGDASHAAAAVEREVGPGILFIDDLQWVDPASREALERLAGRVMVVAAIREGDPEVPGAMALMDRANAETIPLAALAVDAAAAIVRRVRPDASPRAVADAVSRGAGNPLLLEEIARTGESSGVLGRTLEARRGRLSAGARAGLDVLAVASRPLPRSAVTGSDELLRAGLAASTGDRVEIRHALLGESIRASLDEAERHAAHAAAANLVEDSAERARHLLAGGRRNEAASTALGALHGTRDPRARAALQVVLAEATGDPAHLLAAARGLAAISAYEELLTVLRDMPEDGPGTMSEASVLRARATYRTGRVDDAWSMVQELTGRHAAATTRASAMLASETVQMLINMWGDAAGALRVLAEELPRHAPGSRGWMGVVGMRETVRLYLGERPDLELLERGVEEALQQRLPEAVGRVQNLNKAHLVLRGARSALAGILDGIDRLEQIGMESPALLLRSEAAQGAVYAGDFRIAVELADFILERPASYRARLQAAVRRAEALIYLGDFDLARASIELATEVTPGDRADQSERVMTELEMAYWSGAAERAIELADEITSLGSTSPANLALPILTGAWADLELGREIRAVPTVDFRVLEGLPPEVEGIRHLAAASFRVAATSFEAAAERWADYIVPRELVCRWAAADALRRAGQDVQAVERLRAVLGRAESIGFEPLAARIRRSLRLAGVRVSSSGRGSAAGDLALTARESELVRLVGQGLNNLEIARRLGLGRPTVARMLASAMGKLGVDRRTQLAAYELV